MIQSENKRFQAVFFDYGGTLYDYASDREAHLETAGMILERFGIAGDPAGFEEEYTRHLWHEYTHGMGTTTIRGQDVSNHCLIQTLGKFGIDRVTREDLEWFEETTIINHCRLVRLYPDAVDTLKSCRGMGYHLGVISDFDHDFLMRLMEAHGVIRYFDSITCSEKAGALKPHRKIFDEAFLKAGDVSPVKSFYVGDNPRRDMMGAKQYGMSTIFMDVGMNPDGYRQYIDYSINHLGDMIPVVTGPAPGK